MQRTSQGGKEMPGNESGAGRALGISKPNANAMQRLAPLNKADP
jgi:hypothetical protein